MMMAVYDWNLGQAIYLKQMLTPIGGISNALYLNANYSDFWLTDSRRVVLACEVGIAVPEIAIFN